MTTTAASLKRFPHLHLYLGGLLFAAAYACSSVGTSSDEALGQADLEGSGNASHCDAGADGGDNCFVTGCPERHVCKEASPGIGACLFVPDPPPGCMAPCVWEARKDCLPVMGNCTSDFSRGNALCNRDTGWYSARGGGSIALSTIGRHGQACFGALGGSSGVIAYYDNGIVATVSGRAVYCGHEPTDPLPPIEEAFIESDAPECQAWLDTYLTLTNCTTITPGSCAGIAY